MEHAQFVVDKNDINEDAQFAAVGNREYTEGL